MIGQGAGRERLAFFIYPDYFAGCLVALHGFIKKTRSTPDDDLALARKRQKELER